MVSGCIVIAFLLDRGGGGVCCFEFFVFCLFDHLAVMVCTHIVVWYWYIFSVLCNCL